MSRRKPSRKSLKRERREAQRHGITIEDLRRRNVGGGRGVRRRSQAPKATDGLPVGLDPDRFRKLAEGERP